MQAQQEPSTTSTQTTAEPADDLEHLRSKVAQLEHALESRILIEQAKGVLAERLAISIGEAFDILRYAARSHRTKLHEIAQRVIEEGRTPAPVVVAIARSSRIRAASMRERSEARREQTDKIKARLSEQRELLIRDGEEHKR